MFTTGDPEELSPAERERLRVLEEQLERYERTYLRIGWPLREIRDGRLYRATHERFEDYTRERWDHTRQTANRYIAAIEVVEELESRGLLAPKTERQARPLKRLTSDQRAEAAVRVRAEGGFRQVSSTRVAEIADEVAPRPVSPPAPRTSQALILVTRPGTAGPVTLGRSRILSRLREMHGHALAINRLGPYAVQDAMRALDGRAADEVRDQLGDMVSLIGRMTDALVAAHGGEPYGQQRLAA